MLFVHLHLGYLEYVRPSVVKKFAVEKSKISIDKRRVDDLR